MACVQWQNGKFCLNSLRRDGMKSVIGFAATPVVDQTREESLTDIAVRVPELTVADVFTPIDTPGLIAALEKPTEKTHDRTICSNVITLIDTFREAAQEINAFISKNVDSIRSWQETDTPKVGLLTEHFALAAQQLRELGKLATAVVKDPEKFLGANDRPAPGPEQKPVAGYIFDVSNIAHRVVAELGRKADIFSSAVESFQLDLTEFRRFADQDRLRHGEVTGIKKQAINIEAQARSFERDVLTTDGPEGSRGFKSGSEQSST